MGDLLEGGHIDHALVELVPRKSTSEVVDHLALNAAAEAFLRKEIHFSESGTALGFR
jgi:hypothetical protein